MIGHSLGIGHANRLVELAHILDKLYGPVVCAGIDTDVDYKYPKGELQWSS